MTDTVDRGALTRRAAARGSAVADDAFRTDIDIETKDGKTDVVTQADRDAQTAVVECIRERCPDDPIVGEEADELKQVPETGPAWVVDPIDGTGNYVRGLRLWTTAVAAVVDGEPVAGAVVAPALGDTYTSDAHGASLDDAAVAVSDRRDPETCVVVPTFWWDHDRRDEYAAMTRELVTRFGDLRRYGSTQAALAFLAAGAVDGVCTNRTPNPWDSLAGVHLIRQAGGTVTDLDGDPWHHDADGLVASNGHVHDELLAAARAVADR